MAGKLSCQSSLGNRVVLVPRSGGKLFLLWGTLMVDLFATCFNRKLEVFFSVVPDPWAVVEDALQYLWDNLDAYTFPPFCMIRQVINRVMTSRNLRMTLVTPLWPHADWYPDLLALLKEAPREIPSWHNLLCQPHVEKYHQSVKSLSLHGWRLSSIPCERVAFLAG